MKETALGHIIKTDYRDFGGDLDPGLMQCQQGPHRNEIVRSENRGKFSGRSFDQFFRRIVPAVRCPRSVCGRTGFKSGRLQLGQPSFSSELRASIWLVAEGSGNSGVAARNQGAGGQPGTTNMVHTKRRE